MDFAETQWIHVQLSTIGSTHSKGLSAANEWEWTSRMGVSKTLQALPDPHDTTLKDSLGHPVHGL